MFSKITGVKAISFDLDDTLYDNRPVIYNAFKTLYHFLGTHHSIVIEHFSFEKFLQSAVKSRKLNPAEFDLNRLRKLHIQAVLFECSVELALNDEFIEAAFHQFLVARQKVELFNDVINVVQVLSEKVPLITLSNGNVDPKQIGIDQYFKFHLNTIDNTKPKPDVSMFHLASQRLGIQPHELLHIGDSLTTDIQGANNAGCISVWIKPTNFNEACMDQSIVPDVEINQLTQLLRLGADQLNNSDQG